MITPSPQPQTVADLFTWTSLIGPAVVAAIISGLVSAIGIAISSRTARRIHTERLSFERDQAERKFTYDVGVSEAKIKADVALAEKRFALDQAFISWKRQSELAEQVLVGMYEARDALTRARAPIGYSGEGATRSAVEGESEKLKRKRDAYFRYLLNMSRRMMVKRSTKALGRCWRPLDGNHVPTRLTRKSRTQSSRLKRFVGRYFLKGRLHESTNPSQCVG